MLSSAAALLRESLNISESGIRAMESGTSQYADMAGTVLPTNSIKALIIKSI